jgi:hypothetical protein
VLKELETFFPKIFKLDVIAELSYHQSMGNNIVTDPELLDQLSKLKYYEPSNSNPNFDKEWLHFISEEPHDGVSTGITHRINELGQKLHNMTNELFPTYEGLYVGLCDNIDKLFSGETLRAIFSKMDHEGGRHPSFILYVPSRHKTFIPDQYY